MYDPKFEKAVRQRMEELEFRPAESVWASIEKAIVAPRRDRKVGFYWRFLVPGLLVAAGAAIYAYHISAVKMQAKKPADPGTAQVMPYKAASQGAGAVSSQGGAVSRQGGSVSPQEGSVSSQGAPAGASRASAEMRIAGDRSTISVRNKLRSVGTRSGSVGDHSEAAADKEEAGVIEAAGVVKEQTGVIAAQKTFIAPWLYAPGLADQRSVASIFAMAPDSRKTMISLTSLAPARHPWEAGFVAGGGLSRLNRLNVSQANQALSPQALSFFAISGSSAGKNYISDVRPDASFDGGIYLQKALSDRWVFNTGLDLHYYSTQIHVGQQVNVFAAQSSSSYWNYPGTAAAPNVALFSAGGQQIYTNRYFFLELPAAIQWKVNKSRMLPVFLQGGISVARLMSANALYYNSQSGVYSKDGNMVNKTQLNIGSALLVGLPFRGVRIQAGPEAQYGVTSMVNNQSLGDQHMFYAGLRVVVLPVPARR